MMRVSSSSTRYLARAGRRLAFGRGNVPTVAASPVLLSSLQVYRAPKTTVFVAPRSFSDDSHSDFAPQRKEVKDDVEEAVNMISQHVKDNRIMLYMKGTPSMPMCGFSSRVVAVLQDEGVDFSSVNVLDYPSIREGVKRYSDWPTIPQLYVDGEFIGGCDIVTSMHESGELKDVLAAES